MEPRQTDAGRTVHVDRSDGDAGTDGPFYVVYSDREDGRRWGYLCGNCDSLSNAMDSMGRIKCNDCPNLRKPTEWDAAHE